MPPDSQRPPLQLSGREVDVRPFPMQKGPPIPWFIAEAIYERLYRYSGQTLERLAQRGGFGWAEVEHLWSDNRRTTASHKQDCLDDVRRDFDSLAATIGQQRTPEPGR